MAKLNNIPSVDLADFLADDPKRKQKFVDEIGKAYEEIGFVALKNHFLSDKLVEELYKEVKTFFDLPLATKKKYERKEIGGQRGYTAFGMEHAKGRTEGDLKEFWHFGQIPEEDANLTEEYPENVQVENYQTSTKQECKLTKC